MTLVKRVERAFENAEKHESKLTAKVFGVTGLIGAKTRHFLNNVCDGETSYLEIGCFKGASMTSALFGNENAKGVGVEAFLEKYTNVLVKKYLAENIKWILGENHNATIIVGDSNDPSIQDAVRGKGPYNVFYYDGHHGESQTYLGIAQYLPAMADEFILIVDDWCYETLEQGVRAGTYRALLESGIEVVKKWEIWNKDGEQADANSGWWNGMFVAVVKKNG